MKKVICIDGAKVGYQGITGSPIKPGYEIIEGEIYIVTDYVEDIFGKWYRLYGKPDTLYNIKRFVPLSSIDETEMIREKLDVIINEVKI